MKERIQNFLCRLGFHPIDEIIYRDIAGKWRTIPLIGLYIDKDTSLTCMHCFRTWHG